MKKNHTSSKGFTLVEMLIVVAIIVFLASAALISSFAMRDQLEFRSGYNALKGIIGEARNLALSGQSFPDTIDYDQDGITGDDDLILPNGYIVQIIDDGVNVSAVLYADLFSSAVGNVDDEDQLIKFIDLPENIRLNVGIWSKSDDKLGEDDNVSFLYKVPDTAFSLVDNPVIQPASLELRLDQMNEQEATDILRSKYIFIHYLYGIPELLSDSRFE